MSFTVEFGKPRKDYTCKLYILINIKGQKQRIDLPIYIQQSDWDNSKHRVKERNNKHVEYNKRIRQALSDTEDAILEGNTTAVQVKQAVRGNTASVSALLKERADWFADRGKGSSALAFDTASTMAQVYLAELPLSSFTEKHIVHVSALMKADRYAPNTITLFLSKVRSLCRLYKVTPYPFENYKLKMQPTTKNKMSTSVVGYLEKLELTGEDDTARDFLLFLYYIGGSRAADALKRTDKDIYNDVDASGNPIQRICYFASKGNKYINRKLNDKALAIIEKHRGSKYIFPYGDDVVETGDAREDYKAWRKIVAHIDGRLQRIHKQTGLPVKTLSTHVSRHSVAERIRREHGDPYLAQRMLGHSSIKTTAMTYFSDDQVEMDAVTDSF